MKPSPPPGVHPTPPSLARRLARGLQGPILDPACGEGALLVAAWEEAGASRAAARGLFGFEIDPARADVARERLRGKIGGRAGELAARRIVTADALEPGLPWPPSTAILANPPWVSFSGRQRAAISPARLARYKAHYPSMAGWPTLHGAFLERIARHLGCEGTRARVLVPASVCEQERYAPLREAVREHSRLLSVPEDLGENAFAGVCEPAVLLDLVPGSRADGSRAPWLSPGSDPGLLERLAPYPRLSPECFSDPGVHSGNCAQELIERCAPHRCAPLREGRDLTAFRLGPPRLGLHTELRPSSERRFRFASLERYRSIPVLVRQTANRPIAALHTEPTYFRNTLLACKPPPELDPAFVVAVLNSELIGSWHRVAHRDARQKSFPQVKVRHLRALPFPFVERDAAPDLHDAIVREVHALGLDAARGTQGLEELVERAFDAPRAP